MGSVSRRVDVVLFVSGVLTAISGCAAEDELLIARSNPMIEDEQPLARSNLMIEADPIMFADYNDSCGTSAAWDECLGPAALGGTLSTTARFRNEGPDVARDVVVRIATNRPIFIYSRTADCEMLDGAIECTMAELTPDRGVLAGLSFAALEPGLLTLEHSITGNAVDEDTDNDTDRSSLEIEDWWVPVDLEVTHTVAHEAIVGDDLFADVVVRNNYLSLAENAVLTVNIPPELSVISASRHSGDSTAFLDTEVQVSGNTVTATWLELQPGSSVQIQILMTATQAGTCVMDAELKNDHEERDPEDNRSSQTINLSF